MAKAGLNIEKHKIEFVLSDFDSQTALAKLGIMYIGDKQWKLPAGSRVEYIGHEKYNCGIGNKVVMEDDDNWVITIDGIKYDVWTLDSVDEKN